MPFPKKTTPPRPNRLTIRLSDAELVTIKTEAVTHNLDPSEFIRRRALKHRTDVRYDTAIVIALTNAVTAIRQLHQTYRETDHPPPEHQMSQLITEAIAAILRIEK